WRRSRPALACSAAPGDSGHSWAVLRGLTSRHGGMVAAATTSLPERAEKGRNYDYRYAWIRDQCYAGQAAAAAGAYDLLDSAVAFVTGRVLADGPDLRPAYRVDGGPVPDERRLRVPGYPGAPARVGNHVNDQFQLDALGEILLLLSAADRVDRLGDDGRRALESTVAAIDKRGHEADAGIWELDDQRWAHSRLICAAGLRSVGDSERAEALLRSVDEDCLHPSGRWQRAPQDTKIDASLLIPGIRGAVPPDDPRHLRTVRAVIEELADDGYLYRFQHGGDTPLHRAEGAFLLSGFHLALAHLRQGDTNAAVRWFERSRGALGPPGLFTEEFDVIERQLRGNLPQAFVHALLLETAHELGRAGVASAGFEATRK
ncbi:MAG: glycoside hydrolase family 15 protein, partial [Solirubrobacteraceae bacterium]